MVQYDGFLELTIEFYTILKIKDEEKRIFSCRFFGKEYNFNYKLMTEIFAFSEGGICQPPPKFNICQFWFEITNGDRISNGDIMISGLIKSHSCLLMHKFMAHTILVGMIALKLRLMNCS